MKKIITIVVLFTYIMFAQSHRAQANPGVIIAGALTVGSLLLTAGAVKYYAAPNTSVSFSTATGAIGRSMIAQWAVVGAYGIEEIKSKFVTAKIDYNAYIEKAVLPYIRPDGSISQSPYPNITSQLIDRHEAGSSFPPKQINDVISWNGKYYKVTSISYSFSDGYVNGDFCRIYPPSDPQFNENFWSYAWGGLLTCNNGTSGFTHYQRGGWTEVPPPPPVPRTPAAIKAQTDAYIAGSYPQQPFHYYSGEIDDLIRDAPNIVHITDTATPDNDLDTAPPFVPPTSDTSGGQVVEPGTSTTTAPGTQTAVRAQAEAQTKTQELERAKDAVQDYKNAHPGATAENDPVLRDLELVQEKAQAEADAASGISVKATAEAKIPLVKTPIDPAKTSLNINSWASMFGQFTQLGPYKLLQDIEAWFNQLIRPPNAPRFTFPIGGTNIVVDLSIFDPMASLIRWLLSLFIAVGTIFQAVKFWRGTS